MQGNVEVVAMPGFEGVGEQGEQFVLEASMK